MVQAVERQMSLHKIGKKQCNTCVLNQACGLTLPVLIVVQLAPYGGHALTVDICARFYRCRRRRAAAICLRACTTARILIPNRLPIAALVARVVAELVDKIRADDHCQFVLHVIILALFDVLDNTGGQMADKIIPVERQADSADRACFLPAKTVHCM